MCNEGTFYPRQWVQEVIYQRCLELELVNTGLPFSREHDMPIYYHGKLVGTRRVDFLIDNKISVELKSLARLEDVHLAQAINYLEAYNLASRFIDQFRSKKSRNQTSA